MSTITRTKSKKGPKSPLSAAKPAPSSAKAKAVTKKVEKSVTEVVVEQGEEDEEKEKKKSKKSKGKEREVENGAEKLKAVENVVEEPPKKRASKKDTSKEKASGTRDKASKVEPVKAEDKKANKKTSSRAKKAKSPTPSEAGDDDDEPVPDSGDKGEASDDEEEVLLHGFSSESDSSDEEDGVDDAPLDVGKLPTVARDDASVKRKLEKAKKQPSEYRGVIYLGRIPHGFYEDQMRAYFSQFGDVTRLRLSRNKKTGTSKHYGFVEFASSAVAEIVAETMDNYLLMGHIMRCKIIPKDEVHPELWVGANRNFRRVPTDRIERQHQNKERTKEEQKKVEQRLIKRQNEKKRKLQAAGIDYDFEGVSYTKKVKQSS